MAEKRRGLGRGLGALIPQGDETIQSVSRPRDVFWPERTAEPVADEGERDADGPADRGTAEDVAPASAPTSRDVSEAATEPVGDDQRLEPVPGATFAEVPVDDIRPNPRQPRTVFDEDDLAELTHSIREIGVLQPIVVRPVQDDAQGRHYELIMGERRWRASQAAGAPTVPAIVRTTSDDDMLRDALLENLHRSQLNPLEEAAAYQQLLEDFACTQEELASRIGRSRVQIANTIRLLKLPPLVQRRVAAGVLSAGHARALLGLPDGAAMERMAQRIVAEGLSVRTVEELVRLGDGGAPKRAAAKRVPAPELEDLAARLSDRFDTRVKVDMGQRKGKITVEFATRDDLERILGVLSPGEGIHES